MRLRHLAALLPLLLVLWTNRAWSQAHGDPAPAGVRSAGLVTSAPDPGARSVSAPPSRATYDRYCLSCHGADGDGRGPSAQHLGSNATNFTTGVYKCRSTPAASLPSDADLARSIREGIPGTTMPPFIALGPLEQENARDTLKSFSSRWSTESPQASLVVPAEPATSAASIAKGLGIYQNLACATCHGPTGHGAPGGMALRDDSGNPSHVTDLTDRRAIKCGATSADLYRSLMTGLSGTPMSGYAEAISAEDAWDLVHYVSSLRK